jgi:transcription-repair coupling factor (superfamily II helicase)
VSPASPQNSTLRFKVRRRKPERRERDVVKVAPRLGAIAVRLIERIDAVARPAIIFASKSEGRSRALAQLVESLTPDLEVIHFPPWDCLSFDRMPPSPAIVGERILSGFIVWATESTRARLVITSPDALVQQVPPRRE